jgi:MSHA biogenesis protein MshL
MRSNAQLVIFAAAVVALAGCTTARKEPLALEQINAELKSATESRAVKPAPEAVLQSLLPPVTAQLPKADTSDLNTRFDLTVTNASAPQVLNAIVSGTGYSMVIHPGIKDPISLTLKNVTIPEVLNSVRELYGYDYRIEGTLIYVLPATLQTRMFKIEYLTSNRRGSSDLRVSSNTISSQQGGQSGAAGGAGGGAGQAGGGAAAQQQGGGGQRTSAGVSGQSTIVETSSSNDFWREMFATLSVLSGCTATAAGATGPAPAPTPNLNDRDTWGCEGLQGRRLVVSPQSGTVLVRAMPDELKAVASYLRASQSSVERQVLIEAKILEVALNDQYQTGINWTGFFTKIAGETLAIGQLTPGTRLGTSGSGVLLEGTNPIARSFPSFGTPFVAGVGETGTPLGTTGRALGLLADTPGSLFGVALQGRNFAALMSFLDSQGVVHTLSSPRIATMNNQKAVLKVGSDSLFVTRVTGGSTQAAAAGNQAPVVTSPTFEVQSFFSGISLDVTPRIGEDGTILLHVRPSVTDVSQNTQSFNLGTLGTFVIPLVSNTVSETDSVIRAIDGQIVAIGGLMRVVQKEGRQQIPGAGDIPFLGAAFRNVAQQSEKRELVILLKPTIVQSDESWARNVLEARERVKAMDRGYSWGGRGEVFGVEREHQTNK